MKDLRESVNKGDTLKLYIDDISEEGVGIARLEGAIYFVAGASYGDKVSAKVTKVKKNYAICQLEDIIDASQYTKEGYNLCAYRKKCGGCNFGNLNYESQLALKENHVYEKIKRLGDVENPKVNEIIPSPDNFEYRNKAIMTISTGGIVTKKGGVVVPKEACKIGFLERSSHKVVDCDYCQIQSKVVSAIREAVLQYMEEDNIASYDKKWEKGLMDKVVVRIGYNREEDYYPVMVTFYIYGKGLPNANKVISYMDENVYNLDEGDFCLESVYVINQKTKELHPTLVAGKKVIRDVIGELDFEISPLSFFQVNSKQTVNLYNKAMEYCDFTGEERVLDLYCGIGTIGLYAIKAGAKSVLGIEIIKDAVINANRNAVINNIVNARYICGKAEEELPKLLETEDEGLRVDNIDVVVLDPPRRGCEKVVLETIANLDIPKVVYISCDCATLARDIKILGDLGYEFVEATPVDMFPETSHVETVCLMYRK